MPSVELLNLENIVEFTFYYFDIFENQKIYALKISIYGNDYKQTQHAKGCYSLLHLLHSCFPFLTPLLLL
jgi:hypothetical protein